MKWQMRVSGMIGGREFGVEGPVREGRAEMLQEQERVAAGLVMGAAVGMQDKDGDWVLIPVEVLRGCVMWFVKVEED